MLLLVWKQLSRSCILAQTSAKAHRGKGVCTARRITLLLTETIWNAAWKQKRHLSLENLSLPPSFKASFIILQSAANQESIQLQQSLLCSTKQGSLFLRVRDLWASNSSLPKLFSWFESCQYHMEEALRLVSFSQHIIKLHILGWFAFLPYSLQQTVAPYHVTDYLVLHLRTSAIPHRMRNLSLTRQFWF